MNSGHWLMFNGYVKPQYEELGNIPLDAFYIKPEVIIQRMLDMFDEMLKMSEIVQNNKDSEYCANKITIWKKIQIDQNYDSPDIHLALPPVLERPADPDEGRTNIYDQVLADIPDEEVDTQFDLNPTSGWRSVAYPELERVEIDLDPPPIDLDLEESHADEAKRQQIQPQYTPFERPKEEYKADVDSDDDVVIMENPPAPTEKPMWSYVISAGVLIGLAWLLMQETDTEY